MNPLLRIENLKVYFPIYSGVFRKSRRYVRAVDGISLNIKQGEICGIVGESGCGKSTLARGVLNLISPTAGKVFFDNKEIFNVEEGRQLNAVEMIPFRRRMQIIFQDPFASLDPRMNIESIVSEGLLKHKLMSKKVVKEKTVELLTQCGLNSSVLKNYPHEFSGGQRQRISIARSLSLNPNFLICDEPTAALDVSIQSQVLNLMLDLKDNYHLTYLFISHDLGLVRFICDNIAVMYLGKFVEYGKAEQISSNPLHPYSRALISAVPKEHPNEIKERILMHGEPGDAASPPSGCRFHPRCPLAQERCRKEEPRMVHKGNRLVACHFA